MLPSTLDMVPSPSTWNPRPSTLDPGQKDRLVQPRVLFALIQCATMATEVVEVATESEEDVIINCVAVFY